MAKAPRVAKGSGRKKSRSASLGMAMATPERDNESVRIRKISNGYLVSKSGTRKGSYFEEDTYSATDPLKGAKVTAAAPAAARKGK